MRTVASSLLPYCSAKEVPIVPKRKDLLDRIKKCFDSACKYIHEQRYLILSTSSSASGLALAVVALSSETLALLPLALYVTFLGIYLHVSHWNDTARAALDAKKAKLQEERNRLLLEVRLNEQHADNIQNLINAGGGEHEGNPWIQQMNQELAQLRERIRNLRRQLEYNPFA